MAPLRSRIAARIAAGSAAIAIAVTASLALLIAPTTDSQAQGKRNHGAGAPPAQRVAPAARAPAAPATRAPPAVRQVAPRAAAPRMAPQAMPRQPRQAMPRMAPAIPRQAVPRQAVPGQRVAPRFAAPRGNANAIRRGTVPRVAGPGRDLRGMGKSAASRRALQAGPGSKAGAARDAARLRAIERRRLRAIERQQVIGKTRDNLNAAKAGRPGPVGRRVAGEPRRALINRGAAGDRRWVLRNQGFANPNTRNPAARVLARATFGGRYARWNRDGDRRRWRHRHVIGWIGPLFWPYAYDDIVDYAFWPYAYDAFWPYAYDDIYEGFFGPYAVGGPVYASTIMPGGRPRAGGGRAAARSPTSAAAQICTGEASGLTDWPVERIAQTVDPDETQRAALDELRDASARAVALLRSACPEALPGTPTGRMAAMRERLETMREAVRIVRPALDAFYRSLSDEQKARFNAFDAEAPAAGDRRSREADLAQACNGDAAKAGAAPAARLGQALRLSAVQRSALDELNSANAKAAALLMENCSADEALTPPGRLAAMERRLDAMLQALDLVQPALTRLYDSLSDEQKARFNQLERREQAAR